MDWWAAYLGIGALMGFLAGLLGVGGGMVTVPLLALVFAAKGFTAEHLMHMALATAMGCTVFTSVASVIAHHRHGAVDWKVTLAMSPGIVAGALLAAYGAGYAPTRVLAIAFGSFMVVASLQMLFEVKPKATRHLPGKAGLAAAGAVIGAISSVLAAGGAFLSIPFLVRCGVALKRAIGTAAANGFPIALAGSAGYVAHGVRATGLPEGTLGYVYLPALALIVLAGVPSAPLGARLAHRMPQRPLRIVFALVLLAIAVRMLLTS
jgi:uncharacterized membrane protein YfcA